MGAEAQIICPQALAPTGRPLGMIFAFASRLVGPATQRRDNCDILAQENEWPFRGQLVSRLSQTMLALEHHEDLVTLTGPAGHSSYTQHKRSGSPDRRQDRPWQLGAPPTLAIISTLGCVFDDTDWNHRISNPQRAILLRLGVFFFARTGFPPSVAFLSAHPLNALETMLRQSANVATSRALHLGAFAVLSMIYSGLADHY